MNESGKAEQRRESREFTGIETLHLALESPQEVATGKEKRCKKKGMWIPGHTRHSEPPLNPLQVAWRLSPSLVNQAAAALSPSPQPDSWTNLFSLRPEPQHVESVSMCLSPRSGPA